MAGNKKLQLKDKKIKIFIFAFFILIFILQANSSLAMDINYPSIPGALTPQEIEERPAEEQLPLLVNYFTRLFFILVIAIVVCVIIYGGILYFLSGAKPALMLVARNRISQGLLGLLIIACSYLILATINPQLLVFKLTPTGVSQQLSVSFAPDNQITALQIPAGSHLGETLAYLDEKVELEGASLHHRIEVPFLEILETLDEVISLSDNLKIQLANCKCGESKYYIKFDNLKGSCLGGENVKNPTCQNNCQDCGSSASCDLRDVEKKDGKILIDGREITESEKRTSVKYMRLRLQELLAELQVQKTKFSTEQISLIEKTLGANVSNFLGAELLGIVFQEDFIFEKQSLEAQGYQVVLEKPKQFPDTQTVTMSPPAIDPFTFYAFIGGPPLIIDQTIAQENSKTYQESQRASLFAVLSRLSIEEIQEMIQQCLDSAFGQGEFMLDGEEFQKLAEKAIQAGMADFLGEDLAQNSLTFADAFINKLKSGINQEADSQENKDKRLNACLADCGSSTSCQNECQGKTIPINFLSNALAEFLTADLKNQLPTEIQKILSEKLREVIFSKDLNEILTDDILVLLDGVFQGALTKTLEEQIPFLQDNLQRTMVHVLPELVLDPLQTIDYFLINNLKNLKKRINNEIASVAMTLGATLSQPAISLIESYKQDNPQLFTENTEQQTCQTELENRGYYFDSNQNKCFKATPDQINDWENFSSYLFHSFTQKEFCHRASYCWYEKEEEKCQECQWTDISGLSLKNIGKSFLSGLVNFAEQFLVALTQTAVYTLTRYAQVWVEDEIIAPLEPYLRQLTDFQEKLHKFLSSSINQLLPQQISQYLSSNIDQILADICAKSKAGQNIKLYQGMREIEISPEIGNKACQISEELHQNLLTELAESGDLGKKIAESLNTTVFNLLPENIQEVLNKSFAEILWPGITNIRDLIKGTPKQIICGELSASGQTFAQKCAGFKTSLLTGGLLNYPQTTSGWISLTENEKAYCYFIWYACEKPLAGWSQPIGNTISSILTNNCQGIQNNTGCDILVNQTLAYSVFLNGLEQNYGPIEQRTSEKETEEIEAYQWLTVVFPDLIGEIDKVVGKRGLSIKWNLGGNNSPRQQAINADQLNDLPVYRQKGEYFGQAFVSWFSKNTMVHDVLTRVQFGEMKYFHGENYSGVNILGRTPYQFLYNDYCYKIKSDFQKDYANYTINSIISRDFPNAPQYSMESLNRPNEAKALEKLLEASEVPLERKTPYVSCLLLDFNLARVFGLNQQLVRYVQPKEYQIMFDLINDKLSSNERPEPLNNLLGYLYNYTPPSLLRRIGDSLISQGKTAGQELKSFADLLEASIGDQINKEPLNEEIIVLIFRALGKEDLLDKVLGWRQWRGIQEILAQKPVQLISAHFQSPLIENNKITQFSLMEHLADPDGIAYSGDETILGQRYVDTLGRALHLTEPIADFFLAKEKFDEKVNQAVKETQKTIQNSFDKAFLEAPQAGISWLMKSLVNLVGTELGNGIADQMAGACRTVNSQADCQTNEVFKTETKECCSLGEGLVCLPRCRERTEENPCQTELGESVSSDGTQCCFDEECNKCRLSKTVSGTANCQREGDIIKGDLCCQARILKSSQTGDLCCVNIMDCITEKFTFYLEQLGDVLQNGPALNQLID